ncbi:MAG TPA: ribonuclease HII, partial [Armatimonadota bacterium]|nr:ribonuclease HII [Armatimonadota bacterium]
MSSNRRPTKQGEVADLWQYENQARESGHQRIAGVDEAGRGPLAGPVVASAVILPRDFDLTGIRDSKSLTANQREKAYQRIIDGAEAVGVGIVGPETIDRINILQATFEAMRLALDDLGTSYDCVLVDGQHTIPGLGIDQIGIIDGDAKSASIAAASIVAKVTRDCIMAQLAAEFPHYGFEKHKGYCTEEHLRAIAEHGVCKIHRRSFSPVAQKVDDKDCPQQ